MDIPSTTDDKAKADRAIELDALALVREVSNPYWRHLALAHIAIERDDLDLARKIDNRVWRDLAVANIAIRRSDFDLARGIDDRYWRDIAVANIAIQRSDLDLDLARASEIDNRYWRDYALANVAIQRNDLDLAREIDHRHWRNHAVANIAIQRNDLDLAREIDDPYWRDLALAQIAIQRNDLTLVREIDHRLWRNHARADRAIRLQLLNKEHPINPRHSKSPRPRVGGFFMCVDGLRYGPSMWAATAWDDSDWEGARARGWTVMGRLRQRQQIHRREAADARRSQKRNENRLTTELMTAASGRAAYEQSIKARWLGGPTVLAFLFAHPDADAIRMLDARGDYFNVRTGNDWDLFFPGYYRSGDPGFEHQTGSRAVGRGFAEGWFFNPRDFDILRSHVERSSGGRCGRSREPPTSCLSTAGCRSKVSR